MSICTTCKIPSGQCHVYHPGKAECVHYLGEATESLSLNDYETIGHDIGKLVAEKNAKYGDSFHRSGDVLRILYPNGIQPEQFDDALCVVRIVDKLFRVATDRDALGESPYRDIAGYGILGATTTKGGNNA